MSARNTFLFTITFAAALSALTGCGDPPPTPETDGGPGADASAPTCSDGTTLCGTECVDTDQARAHCGACGTACGAGEACVDGACDLLCPSSQTECDGACADTSTDRLHCGGCGEACAAGEICAAGACEVSCPAGQAVCGGACADLQSDPAHCGDCATACPAGAVCNAGECTTSCGAGLTECGGACVDTDSHPSHCGGCDTACTDATGATGFCSAGACRATCEPLVGDCNGDLGVTTGNGCETPLATDADNCGACGRACSYPQAIGGCAAGACVFAGCETGFDDCDGALENGCETELAESELHCGACGSVCATGERCYAGTCAPIAGESCSDPIVLATGANSVHWTASRSDYLTHGDLFAACSTTQPEGPDVVFTYTVPGTGLIALTISVAKPNSERWTMSITSTCGDLSSQLACASALGTTTIPVTAVANEPIVVEGGDTVFVHLTATTASDVPLSNPLQVEVTATPAPCGPGVGGMVGTTEARIATSGFTSLTEYYVAADQDPDGYVYVGSDAALYRVPKAGGPTEDVEALAGLTSAHLGYAMLIDGDDIYTIESTTSTTLTTGRMFRISQDGGATWQRQDYAFFSPVPADDFRAATEWEGMFYLLTAEGTTTVATQIWSVPAGVTTGTAAANLVASIPVEGDCSAIARDDAYFYVGCSDGDRLIRVPVAGGAPVLIRTGLGFNTTVNSLAGDDTDGDGTFDVLYVHTDDHRVWFVCGPTGATPFTAPLRVFEASTSNYGMGFDPIGGVLWSYDDGTREFISLQ